MIDLAFMLWGALVSTSMASEEPEEPTCDDGSAAWDDGRPNFSCTLSGCAPHDRECWDFRLDYCYDETGKDMGICSFSVETCSSILACFDMWLYCEGAYECTSDTSVGCTSGSCTTDAEMGEEITP